MKTALQITHIKQVLLYILESFPDGVDYIKLFKIMYFAQQLHLVRYGRVMVEESFRAVKHGPVPTYTYKALQIAEGKPLEGDFSEFLAGIIVADKSVSTELKPNMDYLSGAALRCLDEAIARCATEDSYTLSDWSHDSAWQQANERMKDDPQKNFITQIDIARAGHATNEMVDYMREKQLVMQALNN